MKKALVIILGFSLLPFSPSHCKNELTPATKVVIGLVAIGSIYAGYHWYYPENTTQPACSNPQQLQKQQDPQQTEPANAIEKKQPQEQPKPTPQTNAQQSLQQIENQKAVDTAHALILQRKDEQKKAALLKEKLQQTNTLRPEVKITPASKPSAISVKKQSVRDHIGDIFAEHLTIIMG